MTLKKTIPFLVLVGLAVAITSAGLKARAGRTNNDDRDDHVRAEKINSPQLGLPDQPRWPVLADPRGTPASPQHSVIVPPRLSLDHKDRFQNTLL